MVGIALKLFAQLPVAMARILSRMAPIVLKAIRQMLTGNIPDISEMMREIGKAVVDEGKKLVKNSVKALGKTAEAIGKDLFDFGQTLGEDFASGFSNANLFEELGRVLKEESGNFQTISDVLDKIDLKTPALNLNTTASVKAKEQIEALKEAAAGGEESLKEFLGNGLDGGVVDPLKEAADEVNGLRKEAEKPIKLMVDTSQGIEAIAALTSEATHRIREHQQFLQQQGLVADVVGANQQIEPGLALAIGAQDQGDIGAVGSEVPLAEIAEQIGVLVAQTSGAFTLRPIKLRRT